MLSKFGIQYPQGYLRKFWQNLFGDNPALSYAIQQISKEAAKVLLMHPDDCTYGFHPDNLPAGFFLVTDFKGDLSLIFNADSPHPKPTPLTPQLSNPKTARPLYGSFSAYFSSEICQKLEIDENAAISYEGIPDANRVAFIAHLFTPKLDVHVIEKLFEGCLNQQFFVAIMSAIDEVGHDELLNLILELKGLHAKLEPKDYTQFKTIFIRPSNNLSELCTDEAISAIRSIEAFNPTQLYWWNNLFPNHSTTTIANKPRWSNLSELSQGFTYFCEQLEEMHLRLEDAPCNFFVLKDMRVGLDRMLTILRHALIPREQWGKDLEHFDLNQFGLFYASRYEGFNLVTKSMIQPVNATNEENPLQGFTYRITQTDRINAILNNRFKTKSVAEGNHQVLKKIDIRASKVNPFLTRVLGSINQRALLSVYEEFIDHYESIKFQLVEDLITFYDTLFSNLYNVLVTFGSGINGKHISANDMNLLKNTLSEYNKLSEYDKLSEHDKSTYGFDDLSILRTLFNLHNVSSRTTIAEFLGIFRTLKKNSAFFLYYLSDLNFFIMKNQHLGHKYLKH